ncbi:MAG: SecDF P1 head subdomain-containing protein [Paludibacter sp.]|jgi:preprotein translocase subunit SecD
MKTINWILTCMILYISTAFTSANLNAQKATFGIYEIAKIVEVPNSLINLLKTNNIQFNKNAQSQAIGYLSAEEYAKICMNLSVDNVRFIKSTYTVDNSKKNFEFAIVKYIPAISVSDIQSTNNKGNNVEIYFNLKGARKWADLTKNNIGKIVAFVIDNQIYTIPVIQLEIRSGEAIINGLKDEKTAESISSRLNSAIQK